MNSTPNESARDSGAAYVFVRSGTTWSQQAYLKASNTGANDAFGTSVAVSGDTIVVGASREGSSTTGVNSTPNESASNSGASYVFFRSGTTWSQQAYLKASNTGGGDLFGWSVAVNSGTVVVGAQQEDSSTTGVNSTPNNSAGDSGASYIFTGFGPLIDLPSLAAATASELTASNATLNGVVISDGGDAITERGFVYSPTAVNADPILGGDGVVSVTSSGTTGAFNVPLSDLPSGTGYSFKAYATNSIGTAYSELATFTTVASSNAKLTELGWGARLSPSFDSDTFSYESFTPIGLDESTLWVITPVAEDPTATITINGQPASEPFLLSNPSNTLSIVVTAQDGVTTRTYTLVVRRPVTYLVPGTNISLSYTVNGSSASVVACNFEATGALVIPPQLGGFNVTSIHPQAFYNIFGLTSVTIPNGVVSIGRSAFYGATGLTSISIPDSVVSIGDSAFHFCIGLTSIHIGAGVTSIGEDAFDDCENLTSFTVDPQNLNYASSGGALFTKDMVTLLQFPLGFTGAYVVPPGVSIIGDNAFEFCDGLTSVSFPSSLTTIGIFAFNDCDGLTSVTIPSSVVTIEPAAFFACRGLTHVTIGSGVSSIGNAAFLSCSSLISATFLGDAPTSMGFSVFFDNAPGFSIYYQESAAGFTTPTWNGYPAQPLATAQSITFAQIPNQLISASPIALTASASSGLPVTIEVVSGPATLMTEVVEGVVVSYSVILTGPGTVTLRASQAGDSTYSPATPVEVSFNVTSNASSNADLTDLVLSEGSPSPAFTNDTLAYESVVASGSASILITPVTADPTATVTVNGQPASMPVPLVAGSNTIPILVTAQNGTTTRTYTLVVIRQTTFADWSATRDATDPLADPENDGISNLLEYAFGLNPQISSAPTNLPQAETVEDNGETYLTLSYTRPKNAGGISYVVEFSNDPTMSAPSSAGEYNSHDNGDGTETITVRDTATNSVRFGRVKVMIQE